MKKLNKKGVTLIELIVSFAIVSIAMIYFYQTIVDLHRMYKNSNKATDEFVKKDYALRVLDAWATKSDNNLSDLLISATDQKKICDMYNMACDDSETKIENNNNFKKITLINNNKELAVYYKYEKTLVDLKLERAGALDEYGNVNSYDNMSNTLKEADDDIVTVGFDNGIIKYEITDKSGKERYNKTNTNTIKEIIERDTKLAKTEQGINEKVQKLVGDDYTIKESIEEIETGVYARVYNIVKADTNATVVKNIYEIENTKMEKLNEFNLNVSGNQSNRKYEDIIGEEMNINGAAQHIENKGSYYLTFELSTNFAYDYCALFFSPKNGTEYEFRWNKNEISNEYIDNVKDIGVIYKKQNDETYVVSFLKLDVIDSYSYIKPYKWDESCKIKLVEAYKYK